MKCTRCGGETNVQYRLNDITPAFQGMCRMCALYWGEKDTRCYNCGKLLSRIYELRGNYYCKECFLKKAAITKGDAE